MHFTWTMLNSKPYIISDVSHSLLRFKYDLKGHIHAGGDASLHRVDGEIGAEFLQVPLESEMWIVGIQIIASEMDIIQN